jgi:hypothetical protein
MSHGLALLWRFASRTGLNLLHRGTIAKTTSRPPLESPVIAAAAPRPPSGRNDLVAKICIVHDPGALRRRYRRDRKVIWFEDNCTENNRHVIAGKEDYFLGADG